MGYYKSLREYVDVLDKANKLIKITRPINKDTQIHPLVWLQYRGLPENQRKAFLFTNIYDSRGNKYSIPGLWGALGASNEINLLGLQCQPGELFEKALHAFLNPIEPVLVKDAPVQEVVYMGDRLLEKGGMDEFPVAIRHPGFDAGPIQSTSNWVSKDPDTGLRNVGRYRSHVYAQDRVGIHLSGNEQHLAIHWQKCRAKGLPLQAAIVVGGPPNLTYASPIALPYGTDEYSLAGGLSGEPVELVKCKSVDLEVPAHADVVIEGEMDTKWLELEGPHGEGAGLLSGTELMPYLNVKCITHRKAPIWIGKHSHMGESDGRDISRAFLFKHLKYDLALSGVLAVKSNVIVMSNLADQFEVWRALEAWRGMSRMVVAVNEDIDIDDESRVRWAIDTRVLPHRDCRIVKYLTKDFKPSYFIPEHEMVKVRHRQFEAEFEVPEHDEMGYWPKEAPCDPTRPEDSRLLINATMKWPYPPMSLPKKEFMEEALSIWQEEGLPPLKLKEPWYSYDMGFWPEEFAEVAERAVKGEYYKTSEMRARNRVKVK